MLALHDRTRLCPNSGFFFRSASHHDNLTVRLKRLGLIYLWDGDKRIYRSKDELTVQGNLFYN